MSRPYREPRVTPDDKDGGGKFTEFSGVVNTRSRKDLGLKALYVGDNVVISDSKKVTRRDGYSLYRAGSIKSAFANADDLYVVDGTNLLHTVGGDTTLLTGLTGQDYGWAEANGDAYFVNGVEAGILRGRNYRPWRLDPPVVTSVAVVDSGVAPTTAFGMGAAYVAALFRLCATYETADGRETAPSDVVELTAAPTAHTLSITVPTGYARTNIYCTEPDGAVFRLVNTTNNVTSTFNPARSGRELTTLGCSGLPTGVHKVEFFQGRCFAAEYIAQVDLSVVWISRPLAFHLFDQGSDFCVLPGKVGMLVWCNEGLLIGTSRKIFQYDEKGVLNWLVNYGVIPGSAFDTDGAEQVAYFWTERGMCKAMPFENLTEKQLSAAPGLRAAVAVMYRNGMQQMVVVTQGGGNPFNARTERA
jgi:hypothetical protein